MPFVPQQQCNSRDFCTLPCFAHVRRTGFISTVSWRGWGVVVRWRAARSAFALPPCTLQIGKNKSSADENVMTQLNVKGELFPTVHPELSCATLLFYGLLSLLVMI